METPSTTVSSDFMTPSLARAGVAGVFPFLAPRAVPTGHARIRYADGRIEAVSQVPEWYWGTSDRFVGRVTVGLRGGVYLYTYFTCEDVGGDDVFETVVMTPDDPGVWTVLAHSRNEAEARAVHAAIRSAWWVGDPDFRYPEDNVPALPDGFRLPLHPLDDL